MDETLFKPVRPLPPLHKSHRIMRVEPKFGADPELFITKDGSVVGGERVVTERGIGETYLTYGEGLVPRIVLDGVQLEFNVMASTCRVQVGNDIAATFKALQTHLAATPEFKPSFESVIMVDKDELAKLSEKARQLGCQPSSNRYDRDATVKVTKATENMRSAGGHIHIGLERLPNFFQTGVRERLVVMLDIILGNTCVLIDRDPMAAERRKLYGRAGEFRLPKHGLEYRTLSNFWLRSYPLMSLVFGLTRLACSVTHTALHSSFYFPLSKWNAEEELLSRVDVEKVVRAINTNDAKLARETWNIVSDYIAEFVSSQQLLTNPGTDHVFPLDRDVIPMFDLFLDYIEAKGIEYWFPEDPMTFWTQKFATGLATGWEKWLVQVGVGPELQRVTQIINKVGGPHGFTPIEFEWPTSILDEGEVSRAA